MRTVRHLASACAAASLVVGSLAVGAAAPGSIGALPSSATAQAAPSAASQQSVRSVRDAVVVSKRAKKKKATKVTGWSGATYTANTSRVWKFTVRATGPKKRRVQLQQLVGSSWRTVAIGRTGTSRTRAFAVRIGAPTGTTRLRLRFPATTTHRAALTATKTFRINRPSVPPPVVPPPVDPGPVTPPPTVDPLPPLPPAPAASTHYTFIDTDDSTSPATQARWNRCTAIRWGADFARAAAGGLDRDQEKARWASVFAEVTALTGYTFQYVTLADGAGTIDPTNGDVTGYLPGSGTFTGTDLVLTYASPDDTVGYSATGLSGNVIGYGGPLYSYSDPAGPKRIRRGEVLIDYSDVSRFSFGANDLRSLYLHELGHALGLGHFSDPLQVMNPSLEQPAVATYADGDRAGLWQLASQPCFTGALAAKQSAALLR